MCAGMNVHAHSHHCTFVEVKEEPGGVNSLLSAICGIQRAISGHQVCVARAFNPMNYLVSPIHCFIVLKFPNVLNTKFVILATCYGLNA